MNSKLKSGIVAAALAAPFVVTTSAAAVTTPIVLPDCVDVAATPAVPGVPAVTHNVTVVDVPAVPATEGSPEVAAVTHQEFKYSLTTHHEDKVDTTGWVLTVPEGGGWVQTDERTVIDTPAIAAVAEVSHTETVIDHAAYDETIIDSPAIDIPGVAAVHLPAITHVVHHAAVTHVVHHAAVTHQETVTDAAAYDETVIDTPAQPAVPGTDAVTHTEYGFRTRVKLYGSKEVKSVQGYQFVAGSTTKVNGVTIPGHWAAAPSSTTYYDIPDVVINAVWGPSGVPAQYLGSGTVNLSTYGGPNHTVKYKAVKVTTDAGFTDWSDWSDWSTTNNHTNSDLVDTRTRTVTDKAAVPAKPAVPAVTHVVHHAAVTHQVTITDHAAYDETVVDTAAFDETVIDVPAVDIAAILAVHIPAVTHIVHHDAVTHDVKVVDTEAVAAVPAITHEEYTYSKSTPVDDTVEFSDWVLTSPGEGWVQIDVKTVTDHDAIPAVPATPFIPAVTHVETIVDKPAVAPVKAIPGKDCPTALPHTGGSGQADFAVAAAAGLLIMGGAGSILVARRRRSA